MKVKGQAEYTIWSWALVHYFESRKCLPLKVNVKAVGDKSNFSVARNGNIILSEGWCQDPDFSVYSAYSALENLISKKNRQEFQKELGERKIRIEGHTAKGEVVIQELRA